MPTRLVHLVADANDPAALARYWSSLLGWRIADEAQDEVDVWPAGYTYPDPVAVPIVFVPVPEPKTGKNRVHLDLASTSAKHQAELVSRAAELGGRPVDIGEGEVPWTVMADPEGNEFCVLEPRDIYRDTGPVAAILTDCADPMALAQFWVAAAGWQIERADEHLAGLRSPAGVGPTWSSCGCPTRKWSRTGGTQTWRRTAVRTRPAKWRGCVTRAPPWPMSGSTRRCPGPCWPIPRGTSSVC